MIQQLLLAQLDRVAARYRFLRFWQMLAVVWLVAALACSALPRGVRRWTVMGLEKAARAEPGIEGISRETIRRLPRKTGSNFGGA